CGVCNGGVRRPFGGQQYVLGKTQRAPIIDSLGARKEKELVALYRPAEDSSPVVPARRRNRRPGIAGVLKGQKGLSPVSETACGVAEEAIGIQGAVLMEPETLAMEPVGARFRLNQHYRAIAAAEFSREVVPDQLERPNGAQIDSLPVLVFRRVVIVHAVYLKGCATRAGAIEVYRTSGRERRVIHARQRAVLKTRHRRREIQKAPP